MNIIRPSLGRRQFLKQTAGLTFAISLPGLTGHAQGVNSSGGAPSDHSGYQINAYVNISVNGQIVIYSPSTEMGQGVMTSLPLIVSEDMDADWDDVVVRPSPNFGDVYGDPLFLNMIFTASSRSVHVYYERLRIFGAQAREVLLRNAADYWQVNRTELRTEPSVVLHDKTGKRLSYGEIARFGKVPGSLPELQLSDLKSPADFRLIGKALPRRHIKDKADGSFQYSIDIQPPGLVYAAVVRSPVYGAGIATVNDAGASLIPGVSGVYRNGQEVAVVADSFWAALKGRSKLEVTWQSQGKVDTYENRTALSEHIELARNPPQPGFPWDAAGDINAGFNAASTVMEGEYQTGYAYHAAMEPLNAVIQIKDGGQRVEAWVGTQAPAYTVDAIARVAGVDRASVELYRMPMGGGFGRRAVYSMDFVTSAVWLSKKLGKPVKVVWDREDDIRYGYFKPMTAHRLRAALDNKGRIQAWHHRVACEEPLTRHDKPITEAWGNIPLITMLGSAHRAEDRLPLIDAYYLPNRLVEHIPVDTGIRVHAMRGVGAAPNKFAIESFIDEIAARLDTDPLTYRLRLLARSARAKRVLNTVALMARWDEKRDGTALGVAYSHYGESLVAAVAEVSLDTAGYVIKVHHFWLAADVGIAIQPDNLRAQLEGGVIYGLSNCLKENLTLKNGIVQQTNFHDYPLLRANEAPAIHVEIIDSTEHPTGAGEMGTVIAPCTVANAFARLTGKRLRQMPFLPEQVRKVVSA